MKIMKNNKDETILDYLSNKEFSGKIEIRNGKIVRIIKTEVIVNSDIVFEDHSIGSDYYRTKGFKNIQE